jgi:AcrR family transcriptional regulator
MAAPIRTPRHRWIDEGLRALAAGGPDAVRVEPLARVLGVTRGGFYWHFADRTALLEEMLDTWERTSVDEVIAHVEGRGGDAQARLRRLSALAGGSGDLLPIDLAVRDWSRRDESVAARLRRVDDRRMAYLRTLFAGLGLEPDEVESRSLLVFSLWIADRFIAAGHGDRTRAEVQELAMRRLAAP